MACYLSLLASLCCFIDNSSRCFVSSERSGHSSCSLISFCEGEETIGEVTLGMGAVTTAASEGADEFVSLILKKQWDVWSSLIKDWDAHMSTVMNTECAQ